MAYKNKNVNYKYAEVIGCLINNKYPENLLKTDLEYIFKRIPIKRRQALQLCIEGYKQCEIAKILRISEPTVSRYLKHARKWVLKLLSA